jgi:hypothetical protein
MSDSLTSLTPFALGHGGVETIQARVSCVEPNRLQITYLANGNIGTLKIPAKRSPRRIDRLWEHTCFEAFIRADGDPSYYEFNFSPSSEWAVYAFRGYRDGSSLQDERCSPEIVVRRGVDRLELDAVVRLDRLSTIRLGSTLRVGLAAVIEANDGTLFYWALKHPAAKPDFHHPDSFALELAFSSQSG